MLFFLNYAFWFFLIFTGGVDDEFDSLARMRNEAMKCLTKDALQDLPSEKLAEDASTAVATLANHQPSPITSLYKLCDKVEMPYSLNQGRHLVATRTIEPGKSAFNSL